MNQPIAAVSTPRVSDLVLEPFAYSDALRGPALQGSLDYDVAERLSTILPVAIAQLEALGDAYGAMALASLHEQIESLQAA